MDATVEKKKISMGDNLTIARKWKKITQHDLAEKVGLHQTEISTLEKQDVIDTVILERIAKAMDIPVDFFTDFDMEEATRSYTYNNNATLNEGSNEFSANQMDNLTIHNPDSSKDLKEAYDKIADLSKKVGILETENKFLKQGNSIK